MNVMAGLVGVEGEMGGGGERGRSRGVTAIMTASRVLGTHIQGCFEEDEKVESGMELRSFAARGEKQERAWGENEVAFDRR